jgi:endonuclease-8
MPEGHTIHRVARDHSKLLVGRAVAVTSPQGRFQPQAEMVDGVVLDRIEAFGKHLFYWWANALVGHVHLGLFGRFRVHLGAQPPAPIGMVRMRMSTDAATIDLSGPTACEIGTRAERDAIVARLGPDPLRRDAKPQVVVERVLRSRQPIGAILLDQRIIAGLGNVYRAEALFLNGIHPERLGQDLDAGDVEALWDTSVAMLRRGVKDNRIITVHHLDDDRPGRTRLTKRGTATYVYHRDRCVRCGTQVESVDLGGRPCFFCPTCQPREPVCARTVA